MGSIVAMMARPVFVGIKAKYLAFIALALFALAAAAAGISFVVYASVVGDAKTASDLAIARGTMQRAVKLALLGQDARDAAAKVDGLLAGLRIAVAGNELMRETQRALAELEREWTMTKVLLGSKPLRSLSGSDGDDTQARLLAASERVWGIADGMVVRAERESSRSALFHGLLALLLASCSAVATLVIVFARGYVRRNLEFSSVHDALTGLPNKAFFDEFLARVMARAERYGERFAVVQADLDGFSEVNAKHGRAGGDRVLREIADLALRNFRKSDVLFRLGSDTFALFVPNVGVGEATALVDKVRADLRGASSGLGLTACYGICAYERGDTLASLSKRLEAAVYEAKHLGRDRVATVGRGTEEA
jgi:diguanylate cyclase (GGDEF)-like protein